MCMYEQMDTWNEQYCILSTRYELYYALCIWYEQYFHALGTWYEQYYCAPNGYVTYVYMYYYPDAG